MPYAEPTPEESSVAPAPAPAGNTRCYNRPCCAMLSARSLRSLRGSSPTRGDLPSMRKRRRSTCFASTALSAQVLHRRIAGWAVVLLVGLPWTWNCQGGAAAASSSSSSSWGTNFVLTRLDHTESAYCQGQMSLILVNPDPRKSASVQIESSQKIHQVTVPPSDQLMYEDVDCPGLLDQNHDEVPDARQYDTTTPENATRILPSMFFVVQVRSNLPIQAYATTRNSIDRPQDIALLIPTDGWGSTYRLLDFATTVPSSSSSKPRIGTEDSGGTDDDNDDDGTDDGSSSAPRHNRTRYTSFGIVALNTEDDSGSGRSATTSVYLRNDVTGQESATYELMSGQVLWYRSPTSITATPAPASSDPKSATSTPRHEAGPKSDGSYRIRPRPPTSLPYDDDDHYTDDSSTADDSSAGDSSSYNSTTNGLYDITGWHVVASQPVAVFVGSYGEESAASDGAGSDHSPRRRSVRFQTFQQLVPESALGSTYMVCPIEAVPAQGESGNVTTCSSDRDIRFESSCQDPLNRIRYIATRNRTIITLLFPGSDDDDEGDDGPSPASTTLVHLESAGQYYDLETTRPHHVMSNYPLYVYQSLVESGKEVAEGNLRSSTVLWVPSMDQLLRPLPPSTIEDGDAQPSPSIRVAVQNDQSSLRILHAQSNRIAMNDEWVAGDSGGTGTDDVTDDDQLYRTIRRQRRQRHCRSVGVWMGVEYCCTQLNRVPAGLYTITTGQSSQAPAEEPHPIGISVMTVSSVGSGEAAHSEVTFKGEFLADFFDPGNYDDPDQGGGSSGEIGTSRPTSRPTNLPILGNPPTPSPSQVRPRADDSVVTATTPSRRVYSYSGGIALLEAPAVCSTGGPYQKRMFHFPSPNFPLSGESACRNDAFPAQVKWSSSASSNAVFSTPNLVDTKVRFLQPGLFTLCMAVTCQDDVATGAPAANPVTCCTTFEAIDDRCDAGGLYKIEAADHDLPTSTTLKGAVETCEDGTAPAVRWFHNATDDDPRKDDVTFAQPDRLDGRVTASSYGNFEICLSARCGASDLLHHQCCARLRVRELPSEAGIRQEPMRSDAPSAVVQPSPTSSSPASSEVGPSRKPSNSATTNHSDPGSTGGLATEPGLPSSVTPSPARDGTRKRNGRGGGGGKPRTGDRPGRDRGPGGRTMNKNKDRDSTFLGKTLRNIFFRGG